MSGRLDEEKLETLRSWGAGLAADERDELRAAGKAILILVEEIERLQVDVWRTRHDGASGTSGTVDDPDVAPEAEAATPVLESTLRARLRRLLHTDAAP